MNRYLTNSYKLLFFFIFSISLVIFEILYLNYKNPITQEILNKKNSFISLVQLPDLAISTEATYIRHRSLGTVFSIYKDDGTLREYFPSSYAISHSHIINKRD